MKSLLSGLLAVAFAAVTLVPLSAQADELETIKKAGEMKIAMTGQYPPFNFVNDKNEVVGFDASIGAEIAKRIGV